MSVVLQNLIWFYIVVGFLLQTKTYITQCQKILQIMLDVMLNLKWICKVRKLIRNRFIKSCKQETKNLLSYLRLDVLLLVFTYTSHFKKQNWLACLPLWNILNTIMSYSYMTFTHYPPNSIFIPLYLCTLHIPLRCSPLPT